MTKQEKLLELGWKPSSEIEPCIEYFQRTSTPIRSCVKCPHINTKFGQCIKEFLKEEVDE